MITISTIVLVDNGTELSQPFDNVQPGATYRIRFPSSLDDKRPLLGSLVVPQAERALKGSILVKVVGELQESEHTGQDNEVRVAVMANHGDFDVLVRNPALEPFLGSPPLTITGVFVRVLEDSQGPFLVLDVGNASVAWRVGILLRSYTKQALEFIRSSARDTATFSSVGYYAFTMRTRKHLLVFKPSIIDRKFPISPFMPIKPLIDPIRGMTYDEAHALENHTSLDNAPAKLFRVPGKRRNRHSKSIKIEGTDAIEA